METTLIGHLQRRLWLAAGLANIQKWCFDCEVKPGPGKESEFQKETMLARMLMEDFNPWSYMYWTGLGFFCLCPRNFSPLLCGCWRLNHLSLHLYHRLSNEWDRKWPWCSHIHLAFCQVLRLHLMMEGMLESHDGYFQKCSMVWNFLVPVFRIRNGIDQ